MSQNNNFEDHV